MINVALTLYEGHHVHGVGPLVNSLYRAGFRGTVMIGFRGDLPSWLPDESRESLSWIPADGLELRFVELPAGITANQLKPWLLVEALDAPDLDGQRFFLFDADILVLAPFAYFEALIETAAALVVDMWFPRVPMTHPWRRAWADLCREAGYPVRDVEDTYGSAFVALSRQHRRLADVWWALTLQLHRRRPDIAAQFKPGTRMTDWFHHTDQDLLAAAVMATDVPLCTLGPEAFGFLGTAHTMLHPTGRKPWQGSALLHLLRTGQGPDLYATHWTRFLETPIPVVPPPHRIGRRLDGTLAAAMSRVYGRR